ncbi:endolytic transglycosylase MltG [Aquimarina intermedia]|uniref:Endolytic murein transglycosylase n=1 Tax=Aquimarina intermedia TaxID=350814 RepID=A0A5S5BYP5_9FLAO|nr:endolytic transglycosylase MltG [Aquimarina intermedia]TYP72291.1 UPF0755 protein [Aquimarina intermedia]
MYIKKILLVIGLMGIIAGSVFAYYVYDAVFSPNTKFESKTAEVYIPTDATYTEFIELISPYIKDIYSFDRIARRKGYIQNIKAGHFILYKHQNNNEIVNTLRSKNVPVKVTFNNQERLENLAGRISEQIEADSLSLLKAFKNTSYLKAHNFSLENALAMYIPNKYEFFWNTSAEGFRDRMYKEYTAFWNDARESKANAIGLSKQEVITIASIVQKETARVDERPRVAGVYMNRYKKGWKLDADPTVIYAIKKKNDDWDMVIKRVLYKDLEIESPYNTYRNVALPPGPITMPDISSIDAVLNHESHDFFFFVANVEKPGYHMFAKNMAQHNRNKAQYVKWINKQKINR